MLCVMDRPVTQKESVAFVIKEVVVKWSGEGKIQELLSKRSQSGNWHKVPLVIANCYTLRCWYKYLRLSEQVVIEKISIRLAGSGWSCIYDLEKGHCGSVEEETSRARFFLKTGDLTPLVALLKEREQQNVMHNLVRMGADVFDEIYEGDGDQDCDLSEELPFGLEPVNEADDDLLPPD